MAAASASGALAASDATKLRDEALAAAQRLEDEAAALHSSNSERSLELQAEADILKKAAAAQERVRLAAAALDTERAQADLLEQQAAALRARLRGGSPTDDTLDDEDAHSVSSEAAAVARLHSQAAAVQNIKNLIPVVLDLQASNYSKWRGYVLLILGRFALKDHVLCDDLRPHDPAWSRMDCVVVSWLFNTISPDLLDVVHEQDGISARAAWLGLEQQFLNNRESRAMLLDAEFRTLCQGALSVDDYCRKMKTMADALADLGEPIPDRTLVLNVLRGLNERFQFMSQLITRQRPFPSFADVRADLRLAELNMAPPSGPPSALVASSYSKAPASPTTSSAPAFPRPHQAAGGASSGNGRGRRHRGGRGQGSPQGSAQGSPQGGSQGGAPGSVLGAAPWPSVLNPWTGSIHMWPGSAPGGSRSPPPRAPPPQHALAAYYASPPAPGAFYPAQPQAASPTWSPWTPESLASAFSTVALTPPPSSSEWVFDSGASSHIAGNPGMVTMLPTSSFPSSIVVGNGATLPVVGTGYSTLNGPFHLNNVLIAPDIIKNLLSIRQFTIDNFVSVEFDPLGVSVKDLRTRNLLLRCDSSGPLYTLQLPTSPSGSCALVATPSSTTWHRRLGHPGKAALQTLAKSSSIVCSKLDDDTLCHACQLGRHVRLPFTNSLSRASHIFDLIHCDVWTSPIVSVSGFKYYLVIVDDYSHFLWTFPLKLKSDTFTALSHFFSYALTQFACTIKSV